MDQPKHNIGYEAQRLAGNAVFRMALPGPNDEATGGGDCELNWGERRYRVGVRVVVEDVGDSSPLKSVAP